MLKSGQKKFLELATAKFGDGAVIERNDIISFAEENSVRRNDYRWLLQSEFRSGRGSYKIPSIDANAHVAMAADIVPIRRDVKPMVTKFDPNAISEHDYAQVPAKDKHYVPFGEFKMIEKIVSSGKFFPVFILNSPNGT